MSNFLNKICNFFLFSDFTDYTSGYICINSEIIKNIKLKGYYGDYFITLITKYKLAGHSIIEIPFVEKIEQVASQKQLVTSLILLLNVTFIL